MYQWNKKTVKQRLHLQVSMYQCLPKCCSSNSFTLAREIVTGGGLDADAQAAVLMQRCKDLGIPWSTAVTNASIIKGKAGFDISVIKRIDCSFWNNNMGVDKTP